jgi:hypothetical protein
LTARRSKLKRKNIYDSASKLYDLFVTKVFQEKQPFLSIVNLQETGQSAPSLSDAELKEELEREM